MPLYEYQCMTCQHHFTLIRSMHDTSSPSCPKCKKMDKVERLISNTSFILKGSGWFDSGYNNTKKTSSEKKSEQASKKNEEQKTTDKTTDS